MSWLNCSFVCLQNLAVWESGAYSLNVPIRVAVVYRHGLGHVTIQVRMKAARSVLEIMRRPGPVTHKLVLVINITSSLEKIDRMLQYRIKTDIRSRGIVIHTYFK